MNDAVDAALGLVVLEDLFNVLLDGDVAAVDVNLEGLLVLFGRVGAELALGDGRDALACGRERVVEAAEPRGEDTARRKVFDVKKQGVSGDARGGGQLSGGTCLSIVTTLYSPESKQHRAMCEPARETNCGQSSTPF